MKKSNILHGWRDPSENPEEHCALLFMFKSNEFGVTFAFISFSGDIEEARNDDKNTFLAWQYLPVWEE